jgi:hypothetical protein
VEIGVCGRRGSGSGSLCAIRIFIVNTLADLWVNPTDQCWNNSLWDRSITKMSRSHVGKLGSAWSRIYHYIVVNLNKPMDDSYSGLKAHYLSTYRIAIPSCIALGPICHSPFPFSIPFWTVTLIHSYSNTRFPIGQSRGQSSLFKDPTFYWLVPEFNSWMTGTPGPELGNKPKLRTLRVIQCQNKITLPTIQCKVIPVKQCSQPSLRPKKISKVFEDRNTSMQLSSSNMFYFDIRTLIITLLSSAFQ